jgi:hypothetical protein
MSYFHDTLAARHRSAEIPESHDVYGWLVGDWDLEALVYNAAAVPSLKGKIHFDWVLQGRAIQDTWILPGHMYGTTLRIWNPRLEAWDIRWFNPLSSHYEAQTGRRVGQEIVQIGARADGTATRWRFTKITSDSFHWIGESLQKDGQNWLVEGEFLAKRTIK